MVKEDDYIDIHLQNLANRLKEFRRAKGYSNYEQFAFDNELPRAQYGRYEKGQDLRFSSLLKVLKALDITLDEFFKEGFDTTSQKKQNS